MNLFHSSSNNNNRSRVFHTTTTTRAAVLRIYWFLWTTLSIVKLALAFADTASTRCYKPPRCSRVHNNHCSISMFGSNNNNNNNNQQTSSSKKSPQEYAPSQIVHHQGETWRLCVGAAVLNSQHQLLVGERCCWQQQPSMQQRNNNNAAATAWQCPQGGVDDAWRGQPKESLVQAACRELYEEMGLQVNRHVVMVDTTTTATAPYNENDDDDHDDDDTFFARYRTTGTNNWLTRQGFAGQELHWVVFRCMDGRGDANPEAMCNLSGLGGENAEFSNAAWRDLDDVVEGIWEAKRAPYLALQRLIQKARLTELWQAQCQAVNLEGKWTRQSCVGVVEALEARGLTRQEAILEVEKAYIQTWERSNPQDVNWTVTTFQVDGVTPRRKLEYRLGNWQEEYKGHAIIFGSSNTSASHNGKTTLRRKTAFLAEPDASLSQIAHVTVTDGPKGVEESRRYLKEGKLVLRRTFWSKDTPDTPVISTEVFVRVET